MLIYNSLYTKLETQNLFWWKLIQSNRGHQKYLWNVIVLQEKKPIWSEKVNRKQEH